MSSSTIRLGREAERVADAWFRSLADWRPFAGELPTGRRIPDNAERTVCVRCLRFGVQLRLDELPHGALHALAFPVGELVDGCFATIAAERYGNLIAEGWLIGPADGTVRVVPPDSAGVVVFAAQVRADVTDLYEELLDLAVRAVLSRRAAILQAASWKVEPVVRRLAEELIQEICGS